MKQLSLKTIKELGGVVDNNHLANMLINHLNRMANDADAIGFNASARAYRKRSEALFNELLELGYWNIEEDENQ